VTDPTSTTSQIAGAAAALASGSRRERILRLLRQEPRALFELARAMGVGDHQISGVLTALCKDGFIERTGQRRVKPETQCPADVWRIRGSASLPAADPANLTSPDALGYPPTLRINDELYDRQPLLPSEGYPGVPYARRTDTGGLRLTVRVDFIECPGCGRPVRQVDAKTRACACGHPDCGMTWRAALAAEPGKAPSLVLIKD
jgi:hypothetical protein